MYTYSNNVPVSATFKSWQMTAGEPDDLIEDDVLTYTVSGGQVTKIHLEMTQAGESEDFNLTYTNGNDHLISAFGMSWQTGCVN